MSTVMSYEMQVMKTGRWVTVGTYQDKDDALRDARGSIRKRYIGVRVIEETYDFENDRYASRTIYRDADLPASPCPASARPAPAAAARTPVCANAGAMPDNGFRVAALSLVTIAGALLAGIGGLFWFNLV